MLSLFDSSEFFFWLGIDYAKAAFYFSLMTGSLAKERRALQYLIDLFKIDLN